MKNNNSIIPFTHSLFGSVRAIESDGKVLFCGKDVATALGYKDATKAVRDHCKGGPIQLPLETAGGKQLARFITEPDVIRLIVSSKMPKAQEFEKWVFEEVIPAVIKHGGYLTPAKVEEVLLNPDTIIQLATQLKTEREQRAALEAQAKQDRPKVLFAEALTVSDSAILVGQLAKLLSQNGIHIGQNRLFQRLREEGYLHKHGQQKNLPTQKSRELGVIDIKTRTVNNPDGTVRTTYTPVVTGKGQQYFINHYLQKKAA